MRLFIRWSGSFISYAVMQIIRNAGLTYGWHFKASDHLLYMNRNRLQARRYKTNASGPISTAVKSGGVMEDDGSQLGSGP